MNNTKRYETAAVKLLGSVEDIVKNPASYAILDSATKVDNLVFTIADDCRRLAENLSRHATQVEEVRYDVTAPTLGSRVGDITENSGRLREAREALFTLVRTLRGPEAAKEFSGLLG